MLPEFRRAVRVRYIDLGAGEIIQSEKRIKQKEKKNEENEQSLRDYGHNHTYQHIY